jgi:nucleotide-binding universal stress UspA family protein
MHASRRQHGLAVKGVCAMSASAAGIGKGTVVVGMDETSATEAVLNWATDEAWLRGVPLRLVSVIQPPVPPPTFGYVVPVSVSEVELLEKQAAERLEAAASKVAELRPDVAVSTERITGLVARSLLDAARGAELLVLGTHGHGELHDLMVGSIGRQIAAHATCPVAVIPVRTDHKGGPENGRVVVGLDGSAANVAAVAFAFDLADRHGLPLTAIHSWDVPNYDAIGLGAPIIPTDFVDIENSELRAMAESLGGWRERHPGVAVRQRIVHGSPAQVLVEASHGAAALVVGTRGHGGFAGLLLGSVSHSLLHHSQCPVVVVRTPA